MPVEAIRARSVAGVCDPEAIVFPTHRPGGETRLEPLERSQALVGLAKSSFSFPTNGSRDFELLATLVRRCRCYTLSVSDLSLACGELASLL